MLLLLTSISRHLANKQEKLLTNSKHISSFKSNVRGCGKILFPVQNFSPVSLLILSGGKYLSILFILLIKNL